MGDRTPSETEERSEKKAIGEYFGLVPLTTVSTGSGAKQCTEKIAAILLQSGDTGNELVTCAGVESTPDMGLQAKAEVLQPQITKTTHTQQWEQDEPAASEHRVSTSGRL
jgi:hypothetical protein